MDAPVIQAIAQANQAQGRGQRINAVGMTWQSSGEEDSLLTLLATVEVDGVAYSGELCVRTGSKPYVYIGSPLIPLRGGAPKSTGAILDAAGFKPNDPLHLKLSVEVSASQ